MIDLGKVIAEGTQDELKARIGGEVVEIRLTKVADRHGDLDRVLELLRDLASAEPVLDHEAHAIRLPVEGGAAMLAEAVRRLDAAGMTVAELSLHRPTLDDVFLTLTGHHAEAGAADEETTRPTATPATGRAGRSATRPAPGRDAGMTATTRPTAAVPTGERRRAPRSTGRSPTRPPSPGGTCSSTSGSRSCSSSRRSSR